MIVFLIGPRGSGKTTVGTYLAGFLGYRFCDTDRLLCAEAGQTVEAIVAREGWPGFRKRESEALFAAAQPDTVVGTGGGIILSAENRRFMQEKGTVIYLSTPVDVLQERLSCEEEKKGRPSLTGGDYIAEIASVLEEREPLYREAAHHIVFSCSTAEGTARAVQKLLGFVPVL